MEFTGERAIEGKTPANIWLDHIKRYYFTSQFAFDKTVLDIACGSGYGAYIISKVGKCKRVAGVDNSIETIDFVLNNYLTSNANFCVGDVKNVPLKSNLFDVIISFETIEHLINYEQFLLELKRLLKKNGQLFISTPNKEVECAFYGSNYKNSLGEFHHQAFNSREFLSILRKHFQVCGIFGQRMVPTPALISPFKRVLKKITPNLFDLGTGSADVRSLTYGFTPRYMLVVCRNKFRSFSYHE